MNYIIGASSKEERKRTFKCYQDYFHEQKKISWKQISPPKAHIWEESSSRNNTKAFQRSYEMSPQQPWPIKATRWEDTDLNDTSSTISSKESISFPPRPILIERTTHFPVNPTYVDTTRKSDSLL